ncbi:hypothetical protein [Hymenobacter sp. YC55]|uniref:hypothetical protein n=1 Tax=Hymenobacter sp. YC55 TaxID=3034019 RepID=UPI0023F95A59|nr:hypothetical protein [Hymenobacter sp. YC55]MDF7810474.1 hypothetical protein [Hymenobacter sp. YC55]
MQQVTAVEAMHAGVLYLVDEHGQRLTTSFEEQLQSGKCWAHLRDGATGQWHVHEFSQAAELNETRILEMLQPFPQSVSPNA